jgi:5-methylcytosine-specific restriction endonuclease McrA
MQLPRPCIRRGGGYGPCSDGGRAIPGRSRCRAHASGWDAKPKSRDRAYVDGRYLANRKMVLAREPTCHWRLPGCTLKSTQADHIIAVSRGGSNGLENLVGACESCNRRRGIDLGNDTKRRRKQQ